jgi:hypothetical protein
MLYFCLSLLIAVFLLFALLLVVGPTPREVLDASLLSLEELLHVLEFLLLRLDEIPWNF